MDGYYDYGPRVVLERPIALIGFMGCRVAATGYSVAAVTGLPYSEIDRLIEHRAGMSRSQLVLEQGRAALDALEAELIDRATAQRPPGLIVLGDGALLSPAAQQKLSQETTLVYIKRPLGILFQEVRGQLQRGQRSWPEFALAPPDGIEELRDLFEARRPGYERAAITLDGFDHHPRKVADALIERLGLLD